MSFQTHTLNPLKTSFLVPRTSILSHGKTFIPTKSMNYSRRLRVNNNIRASSENFKVEQLSPLEEDNPVKIKAVTTVIMTLADNMSNISISRGLDDIGDMLGKTFRLELISSELDPNTGLEKETIKAYGHRTSSHLTEVKYESDFVVPQDFGEIGAVLIENEHHKEMHFKDIILEGFPFGDVHITCNSWVHSKFDNPSKRIFYTNKSYLPSSTPKGLRRLREIELEKLQGSGLGMRKTFERIYDYDVYNDIGDPDKNPALARPVLGGKKFPYPRRCRTGRPRTKSDPLSESRSNNVYVPRDETFSEVKQTTFSATTVRSVVHSLVPQIECSLTDTDLGFPYFSAIDDLFNEGIPMEVVKDVGIFKATLPRLVKAITDGQKNILQFELPDFFNRDKFSWFRDEEFARQTLAGLNPYSIELVREWPLKSKLDPKVYGPAESAITTELVQQMIGGEVSFDSALKDKRLFMLDYHDVYLPYVNKVREQPGTTLYGSRTLFFLTKDGTLRPIAIELTRPPVGKKPQWKQVFTPRWDASSCWLWRLAKAHVGAHDAGFHQLVHHWLRTHCSTEPYIIAANRQLSAMHPVYRLLHPHFRYTMEINALAREALINAGGIIESCFSPGKYSCELSSVAYDKLWRFDMEALPADLIRRGMAVEDPTAEHGLRLTIEDYPFANDGLILWDNTKQWVSDYVNHYYRDSKAVQSDNELQAWWTEVRTKGHADKKDEPWWPVLNTIEDLIQVLTTIIWVTSGHHAAVNFGQYVFGGYFPNRPTIARTNMPVEDPSPEAFQRFLQKPELELLKCFPSQIQATKCMAVLDVLSGHSPDEEYLGEHMEPAWKEDPIIKAAFEKFSGRLKQLEGIIDERNANLDLKNRTGAGVVPYELLKPFSEPGVTGKGVPYSISI